jgi:hypothetical protein
MKYSPFYEITERFLLWLRYVYYYADKMKWSSGNELLEFVKLLSRMNVRNTLCLTSGLHKSRLEVPTYMQTVFSKINRKYKKESINDVT